MPETWRQLKEEADLNFAAKSLGFNLTWNRSGPSALEERRWSLGSIRGYWLNFGSESGPIGVGDVSTTELRTYLLGFYHMSLVHRSKMTKAALRLSAIVRDDLACTEDKNL